MENATNIIFGQRLKKMREDHNLYQEDVGEWFKMQKSTVSQWENGRLPHATIIVELAKKFGCTTDYLLGLSDDPGKPLIELTNNSSDDKISKLLKDNDLSKIELTRELSFEELKEIVDFYNKIKKN